MDRKKQTKKKYTLEQMHMSLTGDRTLILCGYYENEEITGEVHVAVNGREVPVSSHTLSDAHIRQYQTAHAIPSSELVVSSAELPDSYYEASVLKIWVDYDGVRETAAVLNRLAIRRKLKNNPLQYNLDQVTVNEGRIHMEGWAVGLGRPVFALQDARGREIPVKVTFRNRQDVNPSYPELQEGYEAGFILDADSTAWEYPLLLTISVPRGQLTRRLDKAQAQDLDPSGKENQSLLHKGLSALRQEGIRATAGKIWHRLREGRPETYADWIAAYEPGPSELETQRHETFPEDILISVVVPLYRTKPEYLRGLIQSMKDQTYSNWELCMADASAGTAQGEEEAQPLTEEEAQRLSPLTKLLGEEAAADPRVRFITLTSNRGISDNTNAAIQMARGDFIAFADHDDLIAPNAMYEIARAYHEDHEIDVIYSDEDKIDMEGRERFDPHFKSDYNPDLLNCVNYICHMTVVKRDLISRIGNLRQEYDGAQDYDFIFRACESAHKIHHIPRILYRWRVHPASTAGDPDSKKYAFEAGKRAIQAHYDRMGLPAEVTDMPAFGTYRSEYHWPDEPLVSILIPNKDHIDLLKQCIESIDTRSVYRNYEYIIIENNSTQEETFDYYRGLEKEHDNLRVVRYEGAFNFSAINNFGEKFAHGEYLLLLNNDTQMIAPEALKEMVDLCRRPDTGVVGARLYYPDDTIQHCGVILGVGPYGGFAGHCFVNMSRNNVGYMNRIICTCDYSAVTGACMMTKKSLYEAVGGLSEDFVVALNDIDYCLKVRQLGQLVVYTPYAEFYHYESRSRGIDADSKKKEERLIREVHHFQSKWPQYLNGRDPYYNPNLTLKGLDWGLKELPEKSKNRRS